MYGIEPTCWKQDQDTKMLAVVDLQGDSAVLFEIC